MCTYIELDKEVWSMQSGFIRKSCHSLGSSRIKMSSISGIHAYQHSVIYCLNGSRLEFRSEDMTVSKTQELI